MRVSRHRVAEGGSLEAVLKGADVEEELQPFFETWRRKPQHATRVLNLLAKGKQGNFAEEILWCMWKWRCYLGSRLDGLLWDKNPPFFSKINLKSPEVERQYTASQLAQTVFHKVAFTAMLRVADD